MVKSSKFWRRPLHCLNSIKVAANEFLINYFLHENLFRIRFLETLQKKWWKYMKIEVIVSIFNGFKIFVWLNSLIQKLTNRSYNIRRVFSLFATFIDYDSICSFKYISVHHSLMVTDLVFYWSNEANQIIQTKRVSMLIGFCFVREEINIWNSFEKMKSL